MVSKTLLISLALLSMDRLAVCSSPTEPLTPDWLISPVGQYKTLELSFTASVGPENPFDTYLLRLQVRDPSGRSLLVDGFYDGDGRGGQDGYVWKVRLCPYETGRWSWRTVLGDRPDTALMNLEGGFTCVSSGDAGGVVARDHHFELQSGDPLFLVGNFLDFADGLPSTHTFMSELTTDGEREAILARQRDFHAANKANLYFANKGDYDSRAVTPWIGTANANDKRRMDLSRWQRYDEFILALKDHEMLASMWFFADDSGFGDLSARDRNRLFRYAMARTSAFTHTMYVICLEYQEGWSEAEVSDAGDLLQTVNPWNRPVSVHLLEGTDWEFTGQTWAGWIASQGGNDAEPDAINAYALSMREAEPLPHVDEEFGILRDQSDGRLRANLWANLCGGAAGGGTGSDSRALQNFIAESRIPFHRMAGANGLVEGGGESRFCLAETGEHYLIYSTGGSFTLSIEGDGLAGRWFDPRDPEAGLGEPFDVPPGTHEFVPPSDAGEDWVLWITSSRNLTRGITRPSDDARLVRALVLR